MYVLLRNTESRMMLEIDTWQSLLQLAQDNGWMPEGIEPVDYYSTDRDAHGTGYTPRKSSLRCRIRTSDARRMGKSIHKAMVQNDLIKPKKVTLKDDGIVTALDELIQVRNFMEAGSSILERVGEYNKKEHPKVLRRIDGLLADMN